MFHMPIEDSKRQEDDEAALEKSGQRFGAIVETMSDGILILDPKGKVLYCNPGAGALFDRPVQALMGTELNFPEEDTAEIDIARPGKGPCHVLVRVQKTNWCGLEARLVVLTDITSSKETEKEQESARQTQLRMRDVIISRVSHELRSPLNAVYQYVTILLDELAGKINDEQRQYLGIALRNVKRLQAMIGDLLDVTRSKSGKLVVIPRELNLAETIGAAIDTVRPAAQAKNLSLSVHLAEGLPSAYADPQRVQQIVVNLVDNAIKFTSAGGTIRVEARACEEAPAVGEPRPENAAEAGKAAAGAAATRWIEVSVADSGCGIGEEDHERIFQELYQVDKSIDQKRMGLGLGLYICRDLVFRHGGKIWVKSRLGEGSTFFFTVPVYTPEHAVLSLVRERLARAKAAGGTFAVVVAEADSSAEAIRPVWEALLAAAREKALAAAYAGTRFVALIDAGAAQAGAARNRLRRLAKDACFQTASELSIALSYGVAVPGEDEESADALLARAGAAAVSERALLAQKRLIVVDDDEQCLKLLHRMVSTLGVQNVRTASSGLELFASLEKELPDLIVLDIVMPGMNGHEVIGRLKENEKTAVIPIVVVSGYVGENNEAEEKALGTAVPLVSKLNMKEVRRWVQYLL